MNKLTQLLLDWFLLRRLGQTVRTRTQKTQAWLNNVKPFSWEAMLLLSLFSWFVYLLLQGIYAKKFISIFAWAFLIFGIDWALLGKQVTIPLIGFKFQHGPWITGAIASLAFLTNDFIITDWRSALISWPILSAVIAAYSRFIQPGLKFGTPGSTGRQDLVLLFLISGLISCWLQFHFLIQDILRTYSQQFDWFYLEDETYQSLLPDDAGIIRSRRFPGLWLAHASLLTGDLSTVLSILQQGINSPEHQQFVDQLASQPASIPNP